MKQTINVKTMTIAALLSAIGIIIPMFAPKIVIGPASFTLASHVPIIIAMFISPLVTIFVSLITTVGFLIAGFPTVIVLRAATHIIFASIGAFILKKNNKIMLSMKSAGIFAFFISLIHAIGEVAVVTYFYYITGMTAIYYDKGYFVSVVLLVGLGTIVHSMIDFSIATLVWKPLQNIVSIPVNARVKFSRN